MITPEEERKRAQAISRLYGKKNTVTIDQSSSKSDMFVASRIWKSCLIALLPVALLYVLVSLYLSLGYTSVSDAQAAGIMLIVAAVIVGIIIYWSIGHYRQDMQKLVQNEVLLFWLLIILAIPLFLLAHLLFQFGTTHENIFITLLKVISSSLLAIFASSFYLLFLATIVEKGTRNFRYVIALLLSLLPSLLYSLIT